MPSSVITYLKGGDRRSIGSSNQVAALAAKRPKILPSSLLAPYKTELLGLLTEAVQPELRWHLAQIIPRLELRREERLRAAAALHDYLADRNSIVRTFAMQALADLAEQDASLRAEVLELIRQLTKSGTAAMRARGRKLLERLEGH